MSARQPTIIATSIGFQPEGPDPQNIRPGPSYELAAELANAGTHPRICTIATAVGDDATRLAAVHNAFSKLGMISSHLTLFPMPNVPDMRAHLLAQDVIWVSGGSTANLLALWRLHGLDVILRECWEAGVVLKGVSAGSLCWHVGGTTDSFGPDLQAVTNGLAFLPYANGVHFDVETQRRPLLHHLIADRTLPEAYATDDGVGLVYHGETLVEAVSEVRGGGAYWLRNEGDTVVEDRIEPRVLPGAAST
jgi:peptidase E